MSMCTVNSQNMALSPNLCSLNTLYSHSASYKVQVLLLFGSAFKAILVVSFVTANTAVNSTTSYFHAIYSNLKM